jgi:hypothetical protein
MHPSRLQDLKSFAVASRCVAQPSSLAHRDLPRPAAILRIQNLAPRATARRNHCHALPTTFIASLRLCRRPPAAQLLPVPYRAIVPVDLSRCPRMGRSLHPFRHRLQQTRGMMRERVLVKNLSVSVGQIRVMPTDATHFCVHARFCNCGPVCESSGSIRREKRARLLCGSSSRWRLL